MNKSEQKEIYDIVKTALEKEGIECYYIDAYGIRAFIHDEVPFRVTVEL